MVNLHLGNISLFGKRPMTGQSVSFIDSSIPRPV